MMRWGVCKCGAWGEAPASFRELKHSLKCPRCGQLMYLSLDPREAAYPERDRVEITEVVNTPVD